jgi:hypothetical protein
MLESGLSGSVRGVPSNAHPYRDPGSIASVDPPPVTSVRPPASDMSLHAVTDAMCQQPTSRLCRNKKEAAG